MLSAAVLVLEYIVSMLTQLTKKADGMGDMPPWSDTGIDYEHEHRCAEHESHGVSVSADTVQLPIWTEFGR